MCGRYTLTSNDSLVAEFELVAGQRSFEPRFNIAPTQLAPIIDNRAKDERTLVPMRWGLIPSWARDPAIGNRMINARCETVAEKPAFRKALLERRCIIPADGFYEWQKRGKDKIPFYIHDPSRGPLAFAGLWERWKSPDGPWWLSFTIITTEANEFMAPLHDRMPVILARQDYDRWLDPRPLPRQVFDDILVPAPPGRLAMYEVSRLVSSPKNDSPACIEPPPQQLLF